MARLTFFLKLTTVLIVSMHLKASAQLAIGIEGGYSTNYFKSNVTATLTEKSTLPGYAATVWLQYSPYRLFALQAGAQILNKNHELRRTGAMTGTFQSIYNTYIQIPVTGQIQARYKKITVYCKLGAYGGYWVAGKIKGKIPNILNSYSTTNGDRTVTDYFIFTPYNEKYTFQAKKDQRFEFGFVTGAGLLYSITNRLSVNASATYYHALTSQQKRYNKDVTPGYNRTIYISAGTMIALH